MVIIAGAYESTSSAIPIINLSSSNHHHHITLIPFIEHCNTNIIGSEGVESFDTR